MVSESSLLASTTYQKSVKENFIQEITSETKKGKYFNMSDLQFFTNNKKNDLALFHMNINLFQFHFGELETFSSDLLIDFQNTWYN